MPRNEYQTISVRRCDRTLTKLQRLVRLIEKADRLPGIKSYSVLDRLITQELERRQAEGKATP